MEKKMMKTGKKKRRSSGNVTHVDNRKSHFRNRCREKISHSEMNSSLRLTDTCFIRSFSSINNKPMYDVYPTYGKNFTSTDYALLPS